MKSNKDSTVATDKATTGDVISWIFDYISAGNSSNSVSKDEESEE